MRRDVIIFGTHKKGKDINEWSLLKNLNEYIGKEKGLEVDPIALGEFPDSEAEIKIEENLREAEYTFLVHGFRRENRKIRANDGYMQLFFLNDALRRASARIITDVLLYFAYCRQDKKDEPRVPISAKVVANLIEKSGAGRVMTSDLHAGQIQGFFDIPVDNFYSTPLFYEYFKKNLNEQIENNELILCSTDAGSIKRNRDLANKLGCGRGFIDKERKGGDKTESYGYFGADVKGKIVFQLDDIISTGGSLIDGAKVLRECGAKYIGVVATHGLCVSKDDKSAEEKLFEYIDKLVITDSLVDDGSLDKRVEVISWGELVGKAIIGTIEGDSVSALFK